MLLLPYVAPAFLLLFFLTSHSTILSVSSPKTVKTPTNPPANPTLLDPPNVRQPAINTRIDIHANAEVYVYHNGEYIGHTKGAALSLSRHMQSADVIGISAHKRSFSHPAIKLRITHNAQNLDAGVSSFFKSAPVIGPIQKFLPFHTKHFNSCAWGVPKVVTSPPNPVPPPFVWDVVNGKPANRLLIRFVLGGEHCSSASNMCNCRAIPNIAATYCYKMNNKAEQSGECKSHTCRTKYECTPGNTKLPLCIRRYVTDIVSFSHRNDSHLYCNQNSVSPPTSFWVLYG